MKGRLHRRGFTLIELLAVVVIIAILAAITTGLASLVARKIRIKRAMNDLQCIQLAIEAFYKEFGHYPPASQFGVQPLDWDPGGSWDPSDGMLDDGTPISIPPGERPGNDIIGLEAYLWSNDRRYWRITGGSAMPDYGGRQLFPKQASKWAHYLKDVPIGEWSPGPQRMNYPDRGNVTFQQYGFTVVDPWGDQSSRSSNTWSAANRYQYGITPDLQDYQLGCWGEDAMPSADDFWIKKFNEKHSYESNE